MDLRVWHGDQPEPATRVLPRGLDLVVIVPLPCKTCLELETILRPRTERRRVPEAAGHDRRREA